MIDVETEGDNTYIKARLKLPMPPNFLSVDGQFVQPGQPGHPQELPKVDVADLTGDALDAIGKAWTQQLKDHAAERRHARVGKPTPR